jgi:hypothetical protein
MYLILMPILERVLFRYGGHKPLPNLERVCILCAQSELSTVKDIQWSGSFLFYGFPLINVKRVLFGYGGHKLLPNLERVCILCAQSEPSTVKDI